MIPWWRTSFGEEEIKNVEKAILNENISQGQITENFEKKIAETLNVPYALVTTSGSVALLMSMIALDIGPEDEVIVPDRTWIATAHAPLIRGAKIKLVDVIPEFPVIDPSKIEQAITNKTKAIIPVHLDGRSADMQRIKEIAKKNNLFVIEDACQALFSKNLDGFLGTQSDIGCFSLGVTKLVSTGQGGILVTKNKEIYEKLKLIRNNGTTNVFKPTYTTIGCNFKFTDIQSAMGLAQFSKANEKIMHVKKVYEKYSEVIDNLHSLKIIPVKVSEGEIPLYIEILCKKRPELMKFLDAHNIEYRPFLPSLHSAPYLKSSEEFPNSKKFAEQGLFLPCGPTQSFENVDYVLNILKKFEHSS